MRRMSRICCARARSTATSGTFIQVDGGDVAVFGWDAAPEERARRPPRRRTAPRRASSLLNPGPRPVVAVVPACPAGARARAGAGVGGGSSTAPSSPNAIARSWFGSSGGGGRWDGRRERRRRLAAGRFCARRIARRAFLFASDALACARRARDATADVIASALA